uniref:Lysosomal alpha-mannosidase-like central domain-containing protein n=1 Tax=Acrobeloides nanus TaxID=290746 RepID=A0A914CB16_9BILA
MADNELCFMVDAPPLGFHTYFISIHSQSGDYKHSPNEYAVNTGPNGYDRITISNGLVQLVFDTSGFLMTYQNLKTNIQYKLTQEFLYYDSSTKNNYKIGSRFESGPYIFTSKGPPRRFEGQIQIRVIDVCDF